MQRVGCYKHVLSVKIMIPAFTVPRMTGFSTSCLITVSWFFTAPSSYTTHDLQAGKLHPPGGKPHWHYLAVHCEGHAQRGGM